MPLGGLYIAGGIVLKVMHHFKDGGKGEFMDAFKDKGKKKKEREEKHSFFGGFLLGFLWL